MLSAIFALISHLISAILGFVGMILSFVFALPLWMLIVSNLIGCVTVLGIVGAIILKL